MSNDNGKDRPDLSPDQARVYRNYLLTCRRLGITPNSPERAKVVLEEWAAARRVSTQPPASLAREPILSDPPTGEKKTAPKGGSRERRRLVTRR